jgi:beta-galactosidase/beta-glucuronidase
MNTNIPRPEYPRPDFERSEWLNLNGEWDFEFDDNNVGEKNKWYMGSEFSKRILVPFCYQSPLSGLGDKTIHDYVWYKRNFDLPANFIDKQVILNFGAVDYYAKVWVNGYFVGAHKGGYTPFKFDITNFAKEKDNTIVVKVEDNSRNESQLRGKQTWTEENFGCWYTRVTGIWQTVWLQAVSELNIERIKMTPDVDKKSVKFEVFINGNPRDCDLNTVVTFNGHNIAKSIGQVQNNIHSFTLDISSDYFEWKLAIWHPDYPNLYDVSFELSKEGKVLDAVKSYFGMRKISTKGGKILLNNHPIYQRLILDQGYFDGGLLTAGSDEEYIKDIKLIKELGFNGVRKHQKVEDPRFLYWADKLGLLVWGEMASAYEFNDTMISDNMQEWQQTIARDYNHPSIIVWTLMNESWGVPSIMVDKKQQYHTASLYYMVKSYDDTRLAVSNDGWEHTFSDIATFHDYTQDGELLGKKISSKERTTNEAICSIGNMLGAKYLYAEGYEYNGEPVIISECCGVAFDTQAGWGYGKSVHTKEEFLQRYRELLKAVYDADYIVGFCVTQLTDVEQEVNGILTMDRTSKVDIAEFSKIIRNDMEG